MKRERKRQPPKRKRIGDATRLEQATPTAGIIRIPCGGGYRVVRTSAPY